jgi:hypothetical protein
MIFLLPFKNKNYRKIVFETPGGFHTAKENTQSGAAGSCGRSDGKTVKCFYFQNRNTGQYTSQLASGLFYSR